ncbi:putative nuclear pore complex protein [Sesbania bispinosa]|nr:putative nuclear pore complex protein [Sesbania bispinosa]
MGIKILRFSLHGQNVSNHKSHIPFLRVKEKIIAPSSIPPHTSQKKRSVGATNIPLKQNQRLIPKETRLSKTSQSTPYVFCRAAISQAI